MISGVSRGHKLTAPSGFETRPTGDRMKEDLFNILNPLVKGSVFLDLYCGSGAIGIEALSRGAERAVFVDSSKTAIAASEINLRKTRLDQRAQLFLMSVKHALDRLAGAKFDIIFADPPYNSGELVPSLTLINKKRLLADDGIIAVECPNDMEMPEFPGLVLYRQKKYSQMQFLFYRNEGKDQ